MKCLLIILLLSLNIFAEDDPYQDLINEDFEIREKTTKKLGQAEAAYCKIYLDQSRKEGDPEIRYRLFLAAKLVYEKKIAPLSVRWMTFYADVGFETERHYSNSEETGTSKVAEVISFIDSSNEVSKVLKQFDVIVQVDNVDVDKQRAQWQVGKTYELTIKRLKDVSGVQETGEIDFVKNDFDEFVVKIKVSKKATVDTNEEKRMLDDLWESYLDKFFREIDK